MVNNKDLGYNRNMFSKNKILSLVFLLIFLAAGISCTSVPEEEKQNEQNELTASDSKIEQQLKKMTLREKVGQLFIIRPESLDPSYSLDRVHFSSKTGSTKIKEEMKLSYEDYPAGGVILFSRNLISPKQVKEFTSEIHNLSEIPVLVCIDEEGGTVARLANNSAFHLPKLKNMYYIGKNQDSEQAYDAGNIIGEYLAEYGFDVDFAPIADVNTNPKNPVIGPRAFSADPEVAGEMVVSFSKGLTENGVIPCMKHFPGHGDTKTDTHSGYAETLKTWNQLLNCEMIPFEKGIEADIPFIMTAHITVPNVEKEKIPSTLSSIILTDKLRNELGFEGIIITDAMEMGAIQHSYEPDEAVIMAINAGVDIILIPYDYKKCFDAVMDAVEEGTLSIERIDESVRRILSVKNKYKNL